MVSVMAHPLSIIETRRIAVELECDPRSVESEINGRRVRGVVGERIRRYLEQRGVSPSAAPTAPITPMGMRTGRPFL